MKYYNYRKVRIKSNKWEIVLIKVIELVLVKDLINVRQSLTAHITITDS